MNSKDRILVVAPAYNEEGKIGRVVRKVLQAPIESSMLVVDDCSTDETASEARSMGAKVITHAEKSGVGGAIRTGIEYAIENDFDILAVVSGDDQHEPSELGRALEPILNGDADFVQGSRRMNGGRVINDRFFRKITTQLYSLFFSALTGTRITDATNGFRAFRLKILKHESIKLGQEWLNTYELEPYLLYKCVTIPEIKVKEIPITIRYHSSGREYTKMRPVRDWWRLARPMFLLKLGLRD